MEAGDLISIAQKRWWLLVLGALLVAGVTFAVSTRLPKVYESEAIVIVDPSTSPGDSYSSVLAAERTAETYAELIVRKENLRRVIESLDLTLTPEALDQKVRANVQTNSRFIHIFARDRDPSVAEAIANETVAVFLDDLAQPARSTVTQDLDNLQAQIAALRQHITDTEAAIEARAAQPPGETMDEDVVRLRGELRQDQITYASLLGSYVQLQSLDAGGAGVYVVQAADDSPRIVSPRMLLNTSVGALGGLALALGLAIAWARAIPRLTSRADIARILGVPFLGHVLRPDANVGPAGREPVSVVAPGSLAAQCYSRLVQEVQRRHLGNPAGSLLVSTPSSPRYGDAVALNLGALLASAETKVVVVDAHLEVPRLERLLHLAGGNRGLRDLLQLTEDASEGLDVLQATSVEGLYVITTGASQQRLGAGAPSVRAGLMRILPHLKRSANVLVIDAPPVAEEGWVADLAAELDGVLLVVEANETSAGAARQARDALTGAGARLLGVVMTVDDRDGGSRKGALVEANDLS